MISIVIISKDEEALEGTLRGVARQAQDLPDRSEIVVIDASEGRLDYIRDHHRQVRWLAYQRPPGVRVTIPHQRNIGVRAARGEILVFTDAGCYPEQEWLVRLVGPLLEGERVTVGLALASPGSTTLYDKHARQAIRSPYVTEFSTINLAFVREVFDAVGGFDERFSYGSDVDFSWRVSDAGYPARSVPEAVIRHDWGNWRRQLRRSYVYGKARMQLFRKHRPSLKRVLRDDPMVVAYPAFLVGLPLTLVWPFYPALLLIPAWRNRADGPIRVIVDHLVYGVGILAGLVAP